MEKQKKPFLIFLLLFLLVLISVGTVFFLKDDGGSFGGFGRSGGESNSDPETASIPQIIVSILPQVQTVEKIVGDSATVKALIPPGFSAATYEPTTKDIKTIIKADVYFRIGYIDFEKINLSKFEEINSKMVVIDTSINNELRSIAEHNHDEDGNESEQKVGTEAGTNIEILNESEIDPHVWLSPKMVKQQAEVIKNSLVAMYPSNKELYEKNYQELTVELDDLDQKLKIAFKPIQGKTMLVYHPAFGYLADEYGFFQEHIQIEGKEPSIAELQKIIEKAKQQNINVIFVQKQFSKDSTQSIAENIGGVVVQIDPLDPDYLSNMENLASVVTSKIVGQ